MNRSSHGRVAGTVVGVLAPTLVGCGGSDGTSGSSMPWTEWDAVVEREVGAADVGPLCLTFDGEVSGTYTEYEAPDESGAVAVFELEGDRTDLAALGVLYGRLGECADESLEIEPLDARSSTSERDAEEDSVGMPITWIVQVAVDEQAAEPELVGYTSDGTRARIVAGLAATWEELGGVDSWEL